MVISSINLFIYSKYYQYQRVSVSCPCQCFTIWL